MLENLSIQDGGATAFGKKPSAVLKVPSKPLMQTSVEKASTVDEVANIDPDGTLSPFQLYLYSGQGTKHAAGLYIVSLFLCCLFGLGFGGLLIYAILMHHPASNPNENTSSTLMTIGAIVGIFVIFAAFKAVRDYKKMKPAPILQGLLSGFFLWGHLGLFTLMGFSSFGFIGMTSLYFALIEGLSLFACGAQIYGEHFRTRTSPALV